MTPIQFCGCGASLASGARFCGECGKPNKALARQQWQEIRSEAARNNRAFMVVGLVYAAVLGILLVGPADAEVETIITISFFGQLIVGTGFGLLLGVAALRHALGRAPGGRDLLLAGGAAAATLAAALGWVGLLLLITSPESDGDFVLIEWPASLLFLAVMPALSEEWLCRGVLWQAVRPVTTRGTAILATAIPFAFLHMLNGGGVLELPHRFVMGLVLGWLRARTGSIWPCVLAHFVHNAVAVTLD